MLKPLIHALCNFATMRAAPGGASGAPPDLGALPEWRLQDLYESMDSDSFGADFGRERRRRLARAGLRPLIHRQRVRRAGSPPARCP